jgi:ketosteroid isomerase-like protein
VRRLLFNAHFSGIIVGQTCRATRQGCFVAEHENLRAGGSMAFSKRLLIVAALWLGIAGTVTVQAAGAKSKSSDEAQIRTLFVDLMHDVEKQDTKGVVSHYAPIGFMYLDVSTPRAFYGIEGGTYTWDAYFSLCVPGSIKAEATDLHVTVAGDGKYAFAYHFDRYRAKLTSPNFKHLEDITNRATSFLEKIDGKWYIKLEHNSFPVDLATGKPDWVSKDVKELPHH